VRPRLVFRRNCCFGVVGPKHVRFWSAAEPSQSHGQNERAAEGPQDRGLARPTDLE
jgi:hypothetical protein